MSAQAARESRTQLLRRLDETLRKVGAQSVLISDLVARRVGLNSTDLECLDILYLAGPTTAGTLSKHTGLTTGATTTVIDRLERAGFVRRRGDPDDRRRVLVEVQPSSAGRIEPLYTRLASRMGVLNRGFDDQQLRVVAGYLAQWLDLGADHVTWLQTQPLPSVRVATPRAKVAPGAARPRAGRRPASGSARSTAVERS